MRIDAYNQISQIYQANNKVKTYDSNKAGSLDKLEISGLGKDIQSVVQELKDIPDIREDKVERLKTSIENGTYQVSDDAFVNKILEAYNQSI